MLFAGPAKLKSDGNPVAREDEEALARTDRAQQIVGPGYMIRPLLRDHCEIGVSVGSCGIWGDIAIAENDWMLSDRELWERFFAPVTAALDRAVA